MTSPISRVRGLGAIGRAVLGLAVITPVLAVTAPAAAAVPAKPTVAVDHVVLVADGIGESTFVGLRREGPAVTLHDVTVTVDVGDVARFAVIEPQFADETCTTTAAGFTCRVGEARIEKGYAALLPLWVDARDGAKAGIRGTFSTTVTSREFGSVVRRATVTVADLVAFETGDWIERTTKPGQTVKLPLSLKNTGERPITSLVMWFYREAMYTFPQRFSNCRYGKQRVFCQFDDDIPAGATYRLSKPLRMTVRKEVPAPGTIGQSFHWATPADAQGELDDFRAEKPKNGTGAALRLVPSAGSAPPPAGAPEVPQTDGWAIAGRWQSVFLDLTGRNVADLAAVGAAARGKAKQTVAVKVGAKNLGPAFVFGHSTPAARVIVRRPKGTTVTSVPAGCLPSADGKVVERKDPRGAAEYLCTTTVHPFEVGQRVVWTFKLRIDKKGTLTGSVRVLPSTADGKRGNNSAKLRVKPKKR